MRKKAYSPPVYIGQNVYIKPSYVVSIPEFHYESKTTSHRFEKNKENLRNNAANGQLSHKAISSIRNAINWLLVSTKPKRIFSKKSNSSFNYKIAFITLTLPDTHTRIDNAAFQKSLLNPFLVYLRKYHQLKNYVWKMEYQENGKLHCHISLDTFVHWRDVRKRWNALLSRNGYLAKYKETYTGCTFDQYLSLLPANDDRPLVQKQKSWEAGTASNWSDPNSTDIHSIKKVRNLAAYLAKYMAKNKELKIEHEGQEYWYTPVMYGRIWGCNYELSRAKNCKVHIPANEIKEGLSPLFNPKIDFKPLMRENPITKELTQIGEIFYPKAINWLNDITGIVRQTFDKMRNEISAAARHFTNYELSL